MGRMPDSGCNFTLKRTAMKKNLGTVDRVIRALFAVVVAILYFTGYITGTLGIVLLVVAGVLLATSLISFCPIYAMFGLNSCPRKA